MAWKDKASEASQLVREIKYANENDLIKDGQMAEVLHRKMAKAQQLGAEAKQEQLEELVRHYDANASSTGVGSSLTKSFGNGGVMIAMEGLGTSHQEAASKFFDGSQVRLIATEEAARRMAIKDFSIHTQTTDPDALKVLNEGTTTAGGFLVVPQFAQELFAETRRQGNAIRRYNWLSTHPTTSSSVLIPRGGGAATVGIVAENATKPTADQTYSQVTVNIFVWAGISKVSNQLLADGDPVVADLTTRELGSLLGNLEEQKIISGSGTGEPRGILNTTGVVTDPYTDGTPTAQELIDKIIDSIASFQTAYFMPPTGILMHPRRLAFIQKGKDTATNYLFNSPGTFRAPGGLGGTIGATSVSTGEVAAMPSLLGLPIGTSTNIPTNVGAGTNEDVVIVGDWNEAHWFQRQDVTLDASNTTSTAFTDNQTWFRLEERAGFTAERYPTAFRVISGTGLVP